MQNSLPGTTPLGGQWYYLGPSGAQPEPYLLRERVDYLTVANNFQSLTRLEAPQQLQLELR
jgi:hypothetical protein